jgi:hypothetical protein
MNMTPIIVNKDYLKKTKKLDFAEYRTRVSSFIVTRLNHSATLPFDPKSLIPHTSREARMFWRQRASFVLKGCFGLSAICSNSSRSAFTLHGLVSQSSH